MSTTSISLPTRKPRRYLPEEFTVTDWVGLLPWFEELLDRKVSTTAEAKDWLADRSELEAVLGEEGRWRFIRSTLDTRNEQDRKAFQAYVSDIEPNWSAFRDRLDHKFLEEDVFTSFADGPYYPLVRRIKQRVRLFNADNIPLLTEEKIRQKRYEEISGSMSVTVGGQEMTMQQAALHLHDSDRAMRESVWFQLANRRLEEKLELDNLFSELLELRHRVASNAGFSDYRDYRFADLGRFDYSADDCLEFHEAVRTEIVPLVETIDRRKKEQLGLEALKPWDVKAESDGHEPLKPFVDTDDMVGRAIRAMHSTDPYFAECLQVMRAMNHLDLDSRMGKAPGGYNCGMPELGVPFIFMNATGSTRDVKVIMHEGGHAVHSFLSHPLALTGFKQLTSEISELASMSMELFTIDHWDEFYPDPDDLRRARIEHLENVLKLFPWVAAIDRFQHWLYTHPGHPITERERAWLDIWSGYSSSVVDWNGQEHYRVNQWQSQLHLYKVPFYYIEYAIAQLGAIALWRNYRKDPQTTLSQYRSALALGYTRPIGEIYTTAGIEFRFDREYVRELAGFVIDELNVLHAEDRARDQARDQAAD
jgi:oligoendopeptidase F